MRTVIGVLSPFNDILILFVLNYMITLIMVFVLCFQYFVHIPYYNSFISTSFGCALFTLAWIYINSIASFILPINGHFIVIAFGIAPVFILIKNARCYVVLRSLQNKADKHSSSNEALRQCFLIYAIAIGKFSYGYETIFKGLMKLHQRECSKSESLLRDPTLLVDPVTKVRSNKEKPFEDRTYRKFFSRYYFETVLSSFGSASDVQLAFSAYIFYAFKNIHLAYIELMGVKGSKPSTLQLIEIKKLEAAMELELTTSTSITKRYENLPLVIDFEKDFNEFTHRMKLVCDSQMKFWIHIINSNIIDLNVLNKEAEKIYENSIKVESYWKQMRKVNPESSLVRYKYASFQREMKHNAKLADEVETKYKLQSVCSTSPEKMKGNVVLFSESVAIIHISSNKDSKGKIIAVNKSTAQVFGYSVQRLVDSSLKKIMPEIFGERHSMLINEHVNSGGSSFLESEHNLFGLHKEGYCFPIRLFIKLVPKLGEGTLQYVGLIIPIKTEDEYILTNLKGYINCMTNNLAKMLNISHSWIQVCKNLNVIMLAPQLAKAYYGNDEKELEANTKRFKAENGVIITITQPKGLEELLNGRNILAKKRRSSKMYTRTNIALETALEKFNALFYSREGKRYSITLDRDLLALDEYKNSSSKFLGSCVITDLCYGRNRSNFD